MPKPRAAKSVLRGYQVLILFLSGFGGRGWRTEKEKQQQGTDPLAG